MPAPGDLEVAARETEHLLKTETARLTLSRPTVKNGTLETAVTVRNRAGHKFPTAYPSPSNYLSKSLGNVLRWAPNFSCGASLRLNLKIDEVL